MSFFVVVIVPSLSARVSGLASALGSARTRSPGTVAPRSPSTPSSRADLRLQFGDRDRLKLHDPVVAAAEPVYPGPVSGEVPRVKQDRLAVRGGGLVGPDLL